jgi:hypothetical protein
LPFTHSNAANRALKSCSQIAASVVTVCASDSFGQSACICPLRLLQLSRTSTPQSHSTTKPSPPTIWIPQTRSAPPAALLRTISPSSEATFQSTTTPRATQVSRRRRLMRSAAMARQPTSAVLLRSDHITEVLPALVRESLWAKTAKARTRRASRTSRKSENMEGPAATVPCRMSRDRDRQRRHRGRTEGDGGVLSGGSHIACILRRSMHH